MKQYLLSIKVFSSSLAIALMALIVGGCGGGGSANSSGEISVETGSLSRAAFIEAADAICQKSHDRFEREFAAYTKSARKSSSDLPEDFQETLVSTVIVPSYDSIITEISELGAPSGDESEIKTFLMDIQRALDKAQAQPQKTLATPNPFGEAVKAAKAYGLAGCVAVLG